MAILFFSFFHFILSFVLEKIIKWRRSQQLSSLNLTKEEEELTLEEFLRSRFDHYLENFDEVVEQGIESFLEQVETAKQKQLQLNTKD